MNDKHIDAQKKFISFLGLKEEEVSVVGQSDIKHTGYVLNKNFYHKDTDYFFQDWFFMMTIVEKLRNLPKISEINDNKNEVYLGKFELSSNFFNIELVGINNKNKIKKINICYWLTSESMYNDCNNMYDLFYKTTLDAVDFYLQIKNT